MTQHRANMTPRLKVLALAVSSCFIAQAQLVMANPQNPTVAAGQASFQQNGQTLNVTNTPGAIINWQKFNIDKGEVTRFIQQSAGSQVLNRVTGSADPSRILGTLQSNGRVLLINPNGVVFGAGSKVDVAGLIVSSLNISDADFKAGKLRFTDTPGAGVVKTEGTIKTATGGEVILIAPKIENSGIIESPEGTILLAAGRSVEIVDLDHRDIRVEVTNKENQAVNLGSLMAKNVTLLGGLVKNSGVIQATTAVVGENGKIVLKGKYAVENTGTLQASGPQGGDILIQASEGSAVVQGIVEAKGIVTPTVNATEPKKSTATGGRIEILAKESITVDAVVDASGVNAGGAIYIGGDYQGGKTAIATDWAGNSATQRASLSLSDPFATSPSLTETTSSASTLPSDQQTGSQSGQNQPLIPNRQPLQSARTTTIGSNARIRANAEASGDGGVIVVWSNEHSTVNGQISAQAANGSGGLVETSSKGLLTVTSAPSIGTGGQWLLDPYNITVVTTDTDGQSSFIPSASNSTIAASLIKASLDAGTSVTLDTTGDGTGAAAGDITINSAINKTAGGNATLTLNAHNNINLNADITSSVGQLNMVLNANSDGANGGSVILGATTLNANGGTIDASGKSVIKTAGTTNIQSSLSIGTLDISGGILNLNTGMTLAGAVTLSGGEFGGTGNITLSGPFSWTGGNLGNTSGLSGTLTTTGAVDINPGGTSASGYIYLYRPWILNSGATYTSDSTANSRIIFSGSNASLTVSAGQTLAISDVSTDSFGYLADFDVSGINSGLINNGTLAISGSGSNVGMAIYSTFTNNGNISLPSGTRIRTLGGNNITLNASTTFTGTGTFEVNNGTTTIPNDLTLSIPFELTGGTLGGAGKLTLTGPFLWTGGYLGNTSGTSGTLTTTGMVDINPGGTGSSNSIYLYRPWTLSSGATYTSDSTANSRVIFTGNNASLTIPSGQTLSINDVSTDSFGYLADFDVSGINSGLINNGTLAISGSGSNVGMAIYSTFTNNGNIILPSGTRIRTLGGNNITLNASTTFTGTGTFEVNNGTTTIPNDLTLSIPFELTGGTLGGAGNLTLTGPFKWTGGDLGNTSGTSGTLTTTGVVNINPGGTTSSNSIYMYRPWILSSGATYTSDSTANSRVYFGGNNASMTIPTGQTLSINDVSTDTFGYLADFDFSGTNAGLINNGTLAISGSGSNVGMAIYSTFTNNGNITLPSGARIRTLGSNNITLNASTTFTGSGTFEVNNGTTTIPNDLTLSIPFELTGGTLGGAGNLTLNGPFTWTGGNLGTYAGPNGSFTTTGAVTMDPAGANNYGDLYLNRPWNLNSGGSLIADGASNSHLYFYNNAAAVNVPTGQTLNITDTTTDINNYGAYFDYSTTAPGLVNAGTVSLNAGDMYLLTNFTNTGTVNIADTSNFRIAGGTTNLGGSASFSGSGSLYVTGGTVNATTAINPANLIVSGGTANLGAGTALTGNITVSGGILNLNTDMALSGNVILSNGTLGGTGNTTVSGPFTWTGGNLGSYSGTNGSFTTTGSVSMDPGGVNGYGVLYLNRPWNLNSGGSFLADSTSNSHLYFYNSVAALNVPSSQTLSISDSTTDTSNYGASFDYSTTNPGLVNAGTVSLTAGDFYLSTNFTNTGTVNIANASNFRIAGGTTNLGGAAAFTGTGSLYVSGGTVNATTAINPANLIVSGGTLNLNTDMGLSGNVILNNGTLGGTGNTTVSGPFTWTGGTLGNSTGTNGSFTTTGTVTMDPGGANSNGNLYLYRPWNLNSGGSFVADGTYDSYLYFYNTVASLNNPTNQTLSISDTTTDIYNYGAYFYYSTTNPGLVNAGTVSLNAGDFYLSTNATNTGTINIANASNFRIAGGTTNLGGSAAFTGTGSLYVSGGTVNATTAINPANLIVSGGTANFGAGSALTGNVTVSGGILNLNTDMALSGNVILSNGTLGGTGNTIVSGPFTWTGGYLGSYSGPNGSFTTTGAVSMDPAGAGNYGSMYLSRPWNLNSGGSFAADGASHSYLYFYNSAAALNVPAGQTLSIADTTTDTSNYGAYFYYSTSNPGLVNAGTVSLNAGDFYLSTNATNTGTINIANASNFRIAGGTTDLGGSAAFNGTGSLYVSGGTVNATTAINPANLIVNGGTLNLNTDMALSGNVVLNNGILGGTGNTTVSGSFTWTGGYLGNSTGTNGSFTTSGTVAMDPGSVNSYGYLYLYRPWNLNSGGSFVADGAYDSSLYFYNAAAALNVPTGQTLSISDVTTDTSNYGANFYYSTTNPGLVNAGTVSLSAGDLYLSTNFTNTGTVNIANASNFRIAGGTTSLSGSASFSGTGSLYVSGGTVNATTAINPANLIVSGGTANLGAGTALTGNVTVSGGILNLNTNMALSGNVMLSNGTLGGTGNTSVSGPFSWTGGNLGNSSGTNGSFTTTSTVAMDPGGANTNGYLYLYRPWNLNSGGSLIADGNYHSYLYFYNSVAALNVPAGQTLSISDTTTDTSGYGANFGYYSANIGLVNAGTVSLTDGNLIIYSNVANTGTINLATGAKLSKTTGFTNAGTIAGTGTFDVGSSTLINNGTIAPGSAANVGTLTVLGNVNLSTGTLALDLGGTGAGQSDLLSVSGNVTLGGTLNAALFGGYVPTIADFSAAVKATGTASGTFASVLVPGGFVTGYNLAVGEAARLIYNGGSSTKTFTNSAGGLSWSTPGNWSDGILPGASDTVLISSGANSFAVNHASGNDTIGSLSIFSNNSLNISGGSLSVTGSSLLDGTLFVSGSGAATFAGPLTGATSGTINVSGGTLTLNGASSAKTIELTGGKIAGTGAISATDMTWGSHVISTGALDVLGTLAINPGAARSSGTVNSRGTANFASSYFGVPLSDGAVFNNYGVLNLNTNAEFWQGSTSGTPFSSAFDPTNYFANGFAGATGARFVNQAEGTFNRRDYGSGSIFYGLAVDNFGTLNMGQGALGLRAGGTLAGTINRSGINLGGVYLQGGSFSLSGNLGSTALLYVDGASANIVGNLNLGPNATVQTNSGSLAWTSGNLSLGTGSQLTTNGGNLTIPLDSTLSGTGTVNVATGTLLNNGIIEPGGSSAAGTLSVIGNFTMGSGGILAMDMGGTSAGQSDLLNVSGDVALGGTLNTKYINGFVAGSSATNINLISSSGLANSMTGSFATINAPDANTSYTSSTTGGTGPYLLSLSDSSTNTWIGNGSDNNWNTASNWSLGYAPTSAQTAYIPDTASPYLSISGTGTFAVKQITSYERIDIVGASTTFQLVAGGNFNAGLTLSDASLTGAGNLVVDSLFSRTGSASISGFANVSITTPGNLIAGAISATNQITLKSTAGNLTVDGNLATAGGAASTIKLDAYSGIAFNADLNAGSGKVLLNSGGSVTQAAGSKITAGGLALRGMSGNYLLDSSTNAISKLAAETLNVNLTTANAITVGSVDGLTGIVANNNVVLNTLGLTLDYGSSITANASSGNSLVVNVADGAFINNSGYATPLVVAGEGRWLVYSGSPANNNKNGMTSNFRHYGGTYATYAPNTVDESGSGFIYGITPGALQANTVVASGTGSQVYGDTPNTTLGYTLTGFADNEDNASTIGLSGSASFTAIPNATSNFGNYILSYTGGLSSTQYGIAVGSGYSYNVGARPITVTGNNLSRTYGDANATLTYSVAADGVGTSRGLSGSDTLTGSLSTLATQSSNIGAYAIVQGTLDNSNYAITYLNGNLNVTARPITVTSDNKSRVYGDANPALTWSVAADGVGTSRGIYGSDTLSGSLSTASQSSNVGNYAITQGTLANSNYAITYNSGNLNISPRPITINGNSQTRTYGDANSAIIYSVAADGVGTSRGMYGSDTLSGSLATSALQSSNVGSYATTQGTLNNANNSNYLITFNDGNLAVTARPITVTGNNQSRNYGEVNAPLTYTVAADGIGSSRGLYGSDTLSGALSTSATPTSFVGNYAITQNTLANSNYAITYNNGNLAVQADPGNFVWTASTVGNWNTASNWNQGVAPVANSQVSVPSLSGAVIFDSGTANLKSLVAGSALTISGGSFTLGTASNDPSSLTGPLTVNGGTLNLAGGLFTVPSASVTTGGRLISNGGNLALPPGVPLSNTGSLSLTNATINYRVDNQGSIALGGGVIFKQLFSNQGTLQFTSGNNTFEAGLEQSSGLLWLGGGNITGNVSLNGGALRGNGSIFGNLSIGNAVIAPGNSPGMLNISGNLNLTPSSTTAIEIASDVPGTGYDQINVSGTANLNGTLTVNALNGYVPPAGSAYRIMTYSAQTGDFVTKHLLANQTDTRTATHLDLVSAKPAVAVTDPVIPQNIATVISAPVISSLNKITFDENGSLTIVLSEPIKDTSKEKKLDEQLAACP